MKTATREDKQVYWVWSSMIQRCENPKSRSFKNYGAKGITVCKRWRESFDAFRSDMGERLDGMTLERVDSTKGYEPSNCKWADRHEQSNNRNFCIYVDVDGRRLSLKQLWRDKSPEGLTYRALHKRVSKGMAPLDAINVPVRQWPGKIKVKQLEAA